MTKGGPQQRHVAIALPHLPGGLQLLGHGIYAAALTVVLLAILAGPSRFAQFHFLERPGALPMRKARDRRGRGSWGRVVDPAAGLYAFWTAFHPPEGSRRGSRFLLRSPSTTSAHAWDARAFRGAISLNSFPARDDGAGYYRNWSSATLAALRLSRASNSRARGLSHFALVLVQLMIMPDVLIVENYRTLGKIGLLDSIPAIGLPYVASAFGIFLPAASFSRTIPAARAR